MQIKGNQFPSIEQVAGQYLNKQKTADSSSVSESSFLSILQKTQSTRNAEELEKSSVLKFSKHAGERLADRNINLTEEQLGRLEDGAQKASAKGIKESLVLVDNMAFIVNTKSQTVITAMDQNSSDDNIYTNIDGAVVI